MIKHCEICGRDLPESEFSKSYKNRCKKCVAEQTRNNRHLSKNQPKVIDWEERRYELAKAAMCGILGNSRFDKLSESGLFKGNVAGNAISYADEMIRQLRGSNL